MLFRLLAAGAIRFCPGRTRDPAASLPLQNTLLTIGSRLSDAVAQQGGPAATVEGAGGARLFSKIRAEIRVEVAWGLRLAGGFMADPTPLGAIPRFPISAICAESRQPGFT